MKNELSFKNTSLKISNLLIGEKDITQHLTIKMCNFKVLLKVIKINQLAILKRVKFRKLEKPAEFYF